MRDENVGFIPVLDSDDVVIGPILVGFSRIDREPRRLRERRITRIVVIDAEGALMGVISLSDIAQYEAPGRVGRTLQAIAERKYAF